MHYEAAIAAILASHKFSSVLVVGQLIGYSRRWKVGTHIFGYFTAIMLLVISWQTLPGHIVHVRRAFVPHLSDQTQSAKNLTALLNAQPLACPNL
jgi:hypothetical protein